MVPSSQLTFALIGSILIVQGFAESVRPEGKFFWLPIPWITPKPTPRPPTPTPVTPTTTLPPVPQPTPDSIEFMNAFEPNQNSDRAKHGSGPLTRSNTLAIQARNCALYYKVQDPTKPLLPCQQPGEIYRVEPIASSAAEAANAIRQKWYTDELTVALPNWPTKPNTATEHLTQMIWKASTSYGCAVEFDNPDAPTIFYLSCVYSPPGNNWENGGYQANVLQPTSG